jgi:hypothetical protein
MKYICLGYFDEKQWEALSETEPPGDTGAHRKKSA